MPDTNEPEKREEESPTTPGPDPERSDRSAEDPEDPQNSDDTSEFPPVDSDEFDDTGTGTEEGAQQKEEGKPPFPQPDFTTVRIRMFNFSCIFYVLMAAVGAFWMSSQGILKERLLPSEATSSIFTMLLMGGGVAALVVIAGGIFRQFSSWARDFEKEFAPMLNVFSFAQVPIVALLSGIGEEFLFRGALQHSIGIFPSALIFGIVHFPWSKKMIPWPFFAFGLGLAFGYMVESTNSLYAPITGHLLINLLNIALIKIRHPMDPDEILENLLPDR